MTLLHELIDMAAKQAPDKVAIIAEETQFTYEQLRRHTLMISSFLRFKGIQRGDRVIILLPSSPDLLAIANAVSRIGAIFVILNDAITTYSLKYILDDAESALIITDRVLVKKHGIGSSLYIHHELIETITTYRAEDRAEDHMELESITCNEQISCEPVCLIYTSGSTGKPKAVISTHENICFAVRSIQKIIQLKYDDIIGNFLPLSFDYGLYQAFLCFEAQATLVIGKKEDIGPRLMTKLEHWGVTVFPSMPHITSALVRLERRVSPTLRLRVFTTTGARHHHSLTVKLLNIFPDCRIFLMYGLTECKRVSILPPDLITTKAESVGLPLPETECLVVNNEGKVMPPGEVGELIVKGPHVMQGYWRAPKLTKSKFKIFEGQRVLYTGDLFFKDEEGFLYFYGRKDEIFKNNGYRISAAEIESATESIPGIHNAAVIVHRNDNDKAVLFFEGILSVEEIWEKLSDRLEEYKTPHEIIKIDKLPITSNQKVDKRKLMELLSEGGL